MFLNTNRMSNSLQRIYFSSSTFFAALTTLLFLTIANIGSTQNCYTALQDLSGVDQSAFDDNLNITSCNLVNTLNSTTQNDFHVYTTSFYKHLDSYVEFGYPEAFEKQKNQITSTYYLLVAAQNDGQGLYSKFFVEVRFPDAGTNGCLSDLNAQASSLMSYVLEREFNKLGRYAPAYPVALNKAIIALDNFAGNAITCCNSGGDVAECIECGNPDNIAAKLMSLGFVGEPISSIDEFGTLGSTTPEVANYTNKRFTVNDLATMSVEAAYIDQIPIFQAKGLNIKIYVTDDNVICSQTWDDILIDIDEDNFDIIYWHHIHDGNIGEDDALLFTKVILKGQNDTALKPGNIQEKSLGPDPVSAIIGALGSSFADYMIQGISIYYLDDAVNTWGQAFDKVNYGSVAWSGFTGLFVVSSKVLIIAKAVGAATAEVIYNAAVLDDYSWQQAGIDFARVFLSDIIGNAVGGAIGNKFKSANLTFFSKKGLSKLSKTVVDESSATSKKIFVSVGKKLENSGITDKFDDWLWDAKYPAGETTWQHIVARHTSENIVNGPTTKSYFNPKFTQNLDNLRKLITEGAHDWAKYLPGEGTLISYVEKGTNSVQILLDFSTKKAKFGLNESDFIGKATDGNWINTIRITIRKDVKIWNAFPSKTVD